MRTIHVLSSLYIKTKIDNRFGYDRIVGDWQAGAKQSVDVCSFVTTCEVKG
jgi:hypothetical protein